MKKSKTRKGINLLPGMKNMRCPYCGASVQLRSAEGVRKTHCRGVMLYVCSNYPRCDAYVSVHPGTNIPVGSLADPKLRKLRRTAHQYFNKLYTTGLMSKNDAYNWLAYTIQSPLSQAHIGYLSEYYCSLVIKESQRYLDTWGQKIKEISQCKADIGGGNYATQ